MLILFQISLVFVQLGIVLIAYCADKTNKDVYQDIVKQYTGTFGLFICNIGIVIHVFGACITSLVIIADQLDQGWFLIDF